MNRAKYAFLFLLFFAAFVNAQNHSAKFYSRAGSFFGKHVHDGRVDYAAIKKNRREMQEVISMLASFDLESLTDANGEKAFWINAYNLLVISSVVNRYPVKSPLDVSGFFDRAQHRVAGDSLTLNEIENDKLRKKYHDARIHFALVCAAKGCPTLLNQAYHSESLDEQLDLRARATLNDAAYVRVNPGARKILLSEIFRWYAADFTSGGRTVIDYINQYRTEKIPFDFSIDLIPYDWNLNASSE